MTLVPATVPELAAALHSAQAARTRVEAVDLRHLHRICRYAPEDLTVTVEAGITLGSLQAELNKHGQWLPIDPPAAEHLTIADVLDANLSGPHRHGHGTIREYLIGLRVALADGRIIHSGGEVVKNVAGYDLLKLFVGAQRSLGIITEAAFKLLPRPETETYVAIDLPTWEDLTRISENVLENAVTPVVLDAHNIALRSGFVAQLVLGFAGTRDEVTWQLNEIKKLGIDEPGSLDYAVTFARGSSQPISRLSVLPSKLVNTLIELNQQSTISFVARAGQGVVEYRGGAKRATDGIPVPALVRRIKDIFDPAHILPAVLS